mgnify:CR=1 FL=1
MPETATLFLHALTGLHPGSGTALDVIDLPVQRERHTNWPLIPASSLKGVLRSETRGAGETDSWLTVFGPETQEADKFGGAIALTDARVLAFPVRSLKGVFAWVTSPAVLSRFTRDCAIAGRGDGMPSIPDVSPGSVLCASDLLKVDESSVLLEEFDFTVAGSAEDWASIIASRATSDDSSRERIKTHLAILSDDDFTHFVTFATEVSARIGLDSETKTVKKGALFYQEVLPPEVIFYAMVLADPSRNPKQRLSASEGLAWLEHHLPDHIQIGGDESIGRGLCALTFRHGGTEGGAQ